MTRPCTICTHPRREEIDAALVVRVGGYRGVARHFGVDDTSLERHAKTHLAAQLRQHEAARQLASNESLVAEMNRLHAYVTDVLARGAAAQDDRLMLYGVDTGRRNVETLFKLAPMHDLETRLARLEAQTQPEGDDSHADDNNDGNDDDDRRAAAPPDDALDDA